MGILNLGTLFHSNSQTSDELNKNKTTYSWVASLDILIPLDYKLFEDITSCFDVYKPLRYP